MKKSYPKIPFLEMLPPDTTVQRLLDNIPEVLDEIDFPRLLYKNGKFVAGHGDEWDSKFNDLEGVILFYKRQRGRFRDDLTQKEGERFVCQAPCGKKGYTRVADYYEEGEILPVPKDGIDCRQCSYMKFTQDSVLPICRNQCKLFFLIKGKIIPYALYLDPEASGFFWSSYLINTLVQKGLSYPKVVTKLSLKNGKPNFEIVGLLEGRHKEVRDAWLPSIKKKVNNLDEESFRISFPYGKVATCSCNLWRGCTCGMMHREQLAEFNYYTGY